MKIIIASIKSWNIENFKTLTGSHDYYLITQKKDLNYDKMVKINPDYIFFPHWSWLIPENIHQTFNCIVFHMTDLPYGRGGSPLQNLIVRGYKRTKISALKVIQDLDAGPVYIKKNLGLGGTCEEILKRSSDIIFKDMIPFIMENNPQPESQKGEVVLFERRKPEDGNIENLKKIETIYDYIRMLDGEGYPRAFIQKNNVVFEFSDAKMINGEIVATVNIKGKK
ncbi:MAG: hypothetical protein PF503_12690 [Desulfobacula sp.]|jgi:methionyl-tRNA formyltransferase|nr:hypothetical protein [Desulfobacula sp.]